MRKRHLLFWNAYFIPASAIVGFVAGGWWTFLTLFVLFVVDPIVNLVLPADRRNPSPDETENLEHSWLWRWPLWLAIPVQIVLILFGLWATSTLHLSLVEIVGVTLSIGLSSGALGITVAHELMHRLSWSERSLATVLMMSTSYPHFSIEHVHGHHRNVGLRGDPATARKGEGFYAFLTRVILSGFVSAWQIEYVRLVRRARNPRSLSNRMVRYGIAIVALYAAILLAFGWVGVLFFAAQSFVAVVELELTDYIEHYGLVRNENNGSPEPVAARHSWDTDSPLTNWYLFQLGRHADHHLHAGRRYQLLESRPGSPRLPTGYPAMLVLALVPPLWRRIMDHRVDAVAAALKSPADEGDAAAGLNMQSH